MKLCHIVPSLEEQHGGPSKSVRAVCTALAEAGSEVVLLATEPNAPEEGRHDGTGPLRVSVFRRDSPQRICPSTGLRRALETSDAAIFHHHSIWLRTLHYVHRAAQRTGAPLVISPRGMMSSWAWAHRGWRKQLSRAFLHPGAFEHATAWHATSAEEEKEIRALGFHQPVCVAPNGVEPPTPAEMEKAAAHWRQLCPEIGSRRVALFYSRFHEKKRVLELIDLWIACAPSDWLLLLVGIPQDYTPEMLEHRAKNASGRARVLAFSGAGRPPPYAVASLFLLPSHNENFGLVIAEAMAHGVPVVVTDTTPWRAITGEEVGWCVPWAGYAQALTAATGESAAHLAERGRRARTWVVREFSWEKSAQTLLAFYASLTGGGSR